MGYFEYFVFYEKDGKFYLLWVWGCEVDLFGGMRSYFLEYLFGGFFVVVVIFFVLVLEIMGNVFFYIVIWGVIIVVFLKFREVFCFWIEDYVFLFI